jgi:hypothetical protein
MTTHDTPEAGAAHATVYRAILSGALVRQPCRECGAPGAQGHHHRGYDFPLDVVWLCPLHHKAAHRD